MNQLPVLSDLFQKLKINVTHMIYLIMQVMHYRELEVKFLVQINAFVKI